MTGAMLWSVYIDSLGNPQSSGFEHCRPPPCIISISTFYNPILHHAFHSIYSFPSSIEFDIFAFRVQPGADFRVTEEQEIRSGKQRGLSLIWLLVDDLNTSARKLAVLFVVSCAETEKVCSHDFQVR